MRVIPCFQPRLGPKPFTPPKFNESGDLLERTGGLTLDNEQPTSQPNANANMADTTSLPDIVNTNTANGNSNGVNGNEKIPSPEPLSQPDHENNDEVCNYSWLSCLLYVIFCFIHACNTKIDFSGFSLLVCCRTNDLVLFIEKLVFILFHLTFMSHRRTVPSSHLPLTMPMMVEATSAEVASGRA